MLVYKSGEATIMTVVFFDILKGSMYGMIDVSTTLLTLLN